MYLVLKTTNDKIVQMGSVFEAVRGHWVLDPEHAQQCSHVIAVVDKQVKELCIKGAENPVRYVEEDELFSARELAEV